MEICINEKQIGYNYSTVNSAKTEKNDFVEMLIAGKREIDEMMITEKQSEKKNPPDKWVTKSGLSADAVKAAAAYMKNELGIDVDNIKPTHMITQEQMDWLCSRHDFSSMRHTEMYSFSNGSQTQYGFRATPEYSNFLGDLMYLGVYSQHELTVGLWVEPIDTRPNSYGLGISDSLSNYSKSSPIDFSRALISHLENMWSFYDERSKSPYAINGDDKYARIIKEHYLPLQKQFLELMNELFNSNTHEYTKNNSISAKIIDKSNEVSEILKINDDSKNNK